MINTQDIRDKEVINIYDGKSLGFVYDIELDLERGTVEGIVIPLRRRLFHFGGAQDNQVIRWKDIRRIGADVVLVDLPGLGGEITYDRDQAPGMYYREPPAAGSSNPAGAEPFSAEGAAGLKTEEI